MQPPPRSQPKSSTELTVEADRSDWWLSGDLRYKIASDSTQTGLYNAILECPGKSFVTEGARKIGKSYLHGVIAMETALQNPGTQINWVTATQKACRGTLLFILEEISKDAPPQCKGRYDHENGRWVLPNRAYIQLVGAETKKDCEKARGPSSILTIFDEAGFIELLEYMLDSVLKPQMRRVRREVGTFVGLVLSVSTTPYTPAHYFCKMADLAETRDAYRRFTIYDSGFETPAEIEAYIAGFAADKGLSVEAFKRTSMYRREFLSLRVIDEEAVVFSEFHDAELRERIVIEHPRPIGFSQYVWKRVGIDLGMSDKTALLFGYVDFTAGKVVLEGEALLEKPNTKTIALITRFMEGREVTDEEKAIVREMLITGKAVLHPETGQLWPEAAQHRTTRAIDDPHGRVVLDLWDLERVRTDKAVKHDREASIGIIRTMLPAERLLIHPRLTELRRQLLEAMRSKSKKDFARDDSEGGNAHYDLCAALMYFVRGLSLTANPYPPDFDAISGRTLPALHPIVARRAAMHQNQLYGLAGALKGRRR